MSIIEYLNNKKSEVIRFGAGLLAVGTILTSTACQGADDNTVTSSTGMLPAQQEEQLQPLDPIEEPCAHIYLKRVNELEKATCEKQGVYEEYEQCYKCGDMFSYQTWKTSKAHNYEQKFVEISAPTCTSVGTFVTYEKCSDCGDIINFNRGETDHYKDHKFREIIDAITMTHHLVDTVCEDCGYVLEDDKMVEHDYERTYESFDEELHGWETTCKVCGTYHPNATGVTNHWFVKNADGKEVCEDCGYELVE